MLARSCMLSLTMELFKLARFCEACQGAKALDSTHPLLAADRQGRQLCQRSCVPSSHRLGQLQPLQAAEGFQILAQVTDRELLLGRIFNNSGSEEGQRFASQPDCRQVVPLQMAYHFLENLIRQVQQACSAPGVNLLFGVPCLAAREANVLERHGIHQKAKLEHYRC